MKLDFTVPNKQCISEGYMARVWGGRNDKRSRILLYIREDNSARILNNYLNKNFEGLFYPF